MVKSCFVVGAGYIGISLIKQLISTDCKVHVVDIDPMPVQCTEQTSCSSIRKEQEIICLLVYCDLTKREISTIT